MKKLLSILTLLLFSSGCLFRGLQNIPFQKKISIEEYQKIVDKFDALDSFMLFSQITNWVEKNIKYEADRIMDMPAHERRTLYTRRGDCDDSAFLIMKIMESKGLETLLYTISNGSKTHTVCVFKRGSYLYHGGNWGLSQPFVNDDLLAKSIYPDYKRITKRNIKLRKVK